MGLISRVVNYARAVRQGANVSDVTHDSGGGVTHTGEHFQPSGHDCPPMSGDYVVTVSVQRTGSQVVAGCVDPSQQQTALPGEVRIYARDTSGGQSIELYLQRDGSATLSNGSGAITLTAGGTVDINGMTVDPSGNVATPGSVSAPSMVADGKEIAGHAHLAGTPPGNTGPNI
jgi:hypothetical protein